MLRRLLASSAKNSRSSSATPSPGHAHHAGGAADLIFPFAATMEVKHATLAVYNQDAGSASVELIQRLCRTAAFDTIRWCTASRSCARPWRPRRPCWPWPSPRTSPAGCWPGKTAPAGHPGRPALQQQPDRQRLRDPGGPGYAPERGAPAATALDVRNIYNPNLFSNGTCCPAWWPSSPPSAACSSPPSAWPGSGRRGPSTSCWSRP